MEAGGWCFSGYFVFPSREGPRRGKGGEGVREVFFRWDSSQAFVEGCRVGKGGLGLGLGLFVFWSEIDSEFSP